MYRYVYLLYMYIYMFFLFLLYASFSLVRLCFGLQNVKNVNRCQTLFKKRRKCFKTGIGGSKVIIFGPGPQA